ncbi:MAG: glycosyl hydrolase [Bacteroidota bacterium]
MNAFRLSPFAFLLLLFSACSHNLTDPFEQAFLNPPDSARPGVYWYFMDGNMQKEAITGDLESMKQAGIGYVLFLEVNVGVPRGKVDMLSEEWQELFKHAVKECERLGIRLIMGSGPGWAGSGGPWVKPEQSMMHLMSSSVEVRGPSVYNKILAVPAPKTPIFGDQSVPENLKVIRDAWYKDVAVLAFPTPKVRKEISLIDEKALFYRQPYTSVEGVLPYLPTSATCEETPGASIDQDKIIDITDKMNPDGTLNWEAPPGKWTIIRFGTRNNGAVTRPAPVPGLGFEADKFDTAAFDAHYDAYIGKLIRKSDPQKSATGGGWTMIHIDSWEMGAQNWTPRFREEFQKRRGYDPLPFLPTYTGRIVGSEELSERFLWDVRQTGNELIVENHAERFRELGRRSGFRLSIEPYDMNPSADLDLGSVADVPMCEFWTDGHGFNSAFSCFESTSIAHIQGQPVVAAEGFTAWGDEAWKKYPGNMKNQSDWAFCVGINRVVYHTFAHKPYGDSLRPGVSMGPYGVHWDRGQTWWPMVPAYHTYMTRCQYVLSQGTYVADILYLTPEGAPQVFVPPLSATEGTEVMPDRRGFSFDGCSPKMLIRNAGVRDGRIVFPGGTSYSILVLPDIETMTPELLTKIGELAGEGARIIGNPPKKSPSLVGYPQCDSIVKSLAQNLWTGHAGIRTYGLEEGKKEIYPTYEYVADILRESGLIEDFTASGSIRYIHRSLPDREIYFISNRTDQKVKDTCVFRDGTMNAELWDAVTGEIRTLDEVAPVEGGVSLPVKLEPYQSYFVVFDVVKAKGERRKAKETSTPTLHTQTHTSLEGPWKVCFDTAWGGPEMIVFDTLSDWTTRPEPGIRFYSGIARYLITFDYPGSHADLRNSEFYLDLGTVKNLARVTMNGKELGTVWTAPWRVNITGALKKKDNHLEIEVANLWINRLIGDEAQPWDGIEKGRWPGWLLNGTPRPTGRYTFTSYRYYKAGDPLSSSGLIGPVTLEGRRQKAKGKN